MSVNAIGLGIAAAVAFGGATVLMFGGKDGWGWLVFAGIIACMCAETAAK